ncbi:hypothetical protein Q9189_008160 [Teloschistes chrysophthalmus]
MRRGISTALVVVIQAIRSHAQGNIIPFGPSGGAFLGITPGSTLAWIPCNPPSSLRVSRDFKFECARLSVPLDYINRATDRRTIEIAINRVQAQDKTNYLGPLFINPGGPGDPGTGFLFKNAGPLFDQVGKGYDLVSWDPRAVGSTIYPLTCFADAASRAAGLEAEEHLWLFQETDTLDKLAAHQQVTAAGCQQYSKDLLPYIGTLSTVRDLNLMNYLYGFSDSLSYLGFSYGSVLGAAYAATYPTKIKRIAVDGVLDVNRWFFDQQFFITSYIDSDKVLDNFFHLRFIAGQKACKFWHRTEARTRQAFMDIDKKFSKAPIQSEAGGMDTFLALAETDRLSVLKPAAADALFLYIAKGNHEISSNDTLIDQGTGNRNGGENAEIISAVDNPYSFNDLQSLLYLFKSQQVVGTGYLVQSIIATRRIINRYLGVAAIERPAQPYSNIQTSYPILLVGNLRDPITPLQDATNVSSIFPSSSIVLQYNSSGHTSAANPSKCVSQHVFDYFNSENLPKEGEICQPDVLPFGIPAEPNDGEGTATVKAVTLSGFLGDPLPSLGTFEVDQLGETGK